MTDEPAAEGALDPEALVSALARFDGTEPERRTVARQAVDLADSGRYRRDSGRHLSVDLIVAELADAPDGSPADRWNWWIGVLSLAYGGYEAFSVGRYPGSEA
ncbi:hypothetical protein SY89_02967 [Halolamina pelagica]|uniref:Uncharacterized protein n=1 Tax=Halolamina pelagica TaxID=699431 RepID=A0A0N8I0G0_9EURY|nr:hypothetical protein [Halolamina pelagica]KPN32203.1 hypothetical protein SY89_02967 [Halolamina pelagica]